MKVDIEKVKGIIGFCIEDFKNIDGDWARGVVAGYESALRIIQSAEIQRDVPRTVSAPVPA